MTEAYLSFGTVPSPTDPRQHSSHASEPLVVGGESFDIPSLEAFAAPCGIKRKVLEGCGRFDHSQKAKVTMLSTVQPENSLYFLHLGMPTLCNSLLVFVGFLDFV